MWQTTLKIYFKIQGHYPIAAMTVGEVFVRFFIILIHCRLVATEKRKHQPLVLRKWSDDVLGF